MWVDTSFDLHFPDDEWKNPSHLTYTSLFFPLSIWAMLINLCLYCPVFYVESLFFHKFDLIIIICINSSHAIPSVYYLIISLNTSTQLFSTACMKITAFDVLEGLFLLFMISAAVSNPRNLVSSNNKSDCLFSAHFTWNIFLGIFYGHWGSTSVCARYSGTLATQNQFQSNSPFSMF